MQIIKILFNQREFLVIMLVVVLDLLFGGN